MNSGVYGIRYVSLQGASGLGSALFPGEAGRAGAPLVACNGITGILVMADQ